MKSIQNISAVKPSTRKIYNALRDHSPQEFGPTRREPKALISVVYWLDRWAGWNDRATYAELAKATGLDERHVMRQIATLERLGILLVVRINGKRNLYAFTTSFRNILRPPVNTFVTPKTLKAFDSRELEKTLSLGFRAPARAYKLEANGLRPRPGKVPPWTPKGPFSWGVEKALAFSGAAAYAPIYLKFCRKHGDDLLAAVVRDVGDAERARAYSDRPVRSRAALLTWTLRDRMAEL